MQICKPSYFYNLFAHPFCTRWRPTNEHWHLNDQHGGQLTKMMNNRLTWRTTDQNGEQLTNMVMNMATQSTKMLTNRLTW